MIYLLVNPTERCNLRCRYCDPEGRRLGLEKRGTFDVEDLKRLVTSLREEHGAVRIELYGGEPLLEPELCGRILEELVDRLTQTGEFDRAVDSILEGKTDPYTACDELVLPRLND